MKECNEVFDILWEAPRNLPSKLDISKEIREEFKIPLEVSTKEAKAHRIRRRAMYYNILKK